MYGEMYVSYNNLMCNNMPCNNINIGNMSCSIPQQVFCEIETPQMEIEGAMGSDQCINQIEIAMGYGGSGTGMGGSMGGMHMDNGMGNGMMGGMMEIEVKYRMMNGTCEIYKIEAEYEYDD